MDEIARELRNAAADPPPSRIDVAGLIHAERLRHRQRTWVWSGTGVAAAVAAAVLTPALLTGATAPPPGGPAVAPAPGSPTATTAVRLCAGVTPKPTGPQPPLQSYGTVRTRPTEPPADGVVRLTGVVRDVLRTALPAGVRAEAALPGCAEPQFQYHPRYREYELGVTLRRGEERGLLLLRVAPTSSAEATPTCQQSMNPEDCRLIRHADGSTSLASRLAAGPGRDQLWTLLVRRDGTSVLAITNNFRSQPNGKRMESTTTAAEPLLTIDQLVALTRAPDLTLYP
ncbi:hypothetical protein AB0H57_16530 [Micromonospora sp. NPDC050686]|uniref:hypothetical protein n=1 Tax=Micromonospora sp. NPDC050686 TaxID=3154631 RepID=UPI0033C400CD